MESPARELLRDQVKATGGPTRASHSLGCSTTYIHMLCAGDRVPSLEMARKIEDLFGIPMRAWADAPPDPRGAASQPDIAPPVEDEPTAQSVADAEVARVRAFGIG